MFMTFKQSINQSNVIYFGISGRYIFSPLFRRTVFFRTTSQRRQMVIRWRSHMTFCVDNCNVYRISHRLQDVNFLMYLIRIFGLENEGQGCYKFCWKLAYELLTLLTCICVRSSRSSRLYLVTLPHGHTDTMPHRICRNSVKHYCKLASWVGKHVDVAGWARGEWRVSG